MFAINVELFSTNWRSVCHDVSYLVYALPPSPPPPQFFIYFSLPFLFALHEHWSSGVNPVFKYERVQKCYLFLQNVNFPCYSPMTVKMLSRVVPCGWLEMHYSMGMTAHFLKFQHFSFFLRWGKGQGRFLLFHTPVLSV